MTDTSLTDTLHRMIPLAGLLGIEQVVAGPEKVHTRMDWAEDRCTAAGVLHGGAIMALADTTGALCAFFNLPEGAAGTTTIESKTNFLRAVRGGHVEAVAHPLHVGRSVIVVETDVFDAGAKRIAKVTQTQAVLSA